MKVLIITPNLLSPGGVSNYYDVLGLNRSDNIDYFPVFSKRNIYFKLFYFIRVYLKFFFIISKYDIIHLNPSLGKTATWRDLFFIVLTKSKSKKIITFFHGWDDSYEKIIFNDAILKKLFRLYNLSDSFIISGKIFKNKLLRLGISEEKLFFQGTMIADDRFLADFDITLKVQSFLNKNSIVRFLFISRITHGKGMFLAIDIFNEVQKNANVEVSLTIAGDGDLLYKTKQYVIDKEIKNVFFPGYVKDFKKHCLLSESHITLFPTMYGEGIPNTVLEGMLYGMPIISRINAGIPDWVTNNVNGFISDSKVADVYVRYIMNLLDNRELYSHISSNNHIVAKNNFIKSVIEERMMSQYEKLFLM